MASYTPILSHRHQLKEEFEDTKGYSESVIRRTENTMTNRNRTKRKTAIYKTYTYN
jgi:hypothetical protein